MRRYVFWQNIPNHLQSPWISALAKRNDTRVQVITEEEIEERRLQLGWIPPDFSPAELRIGISREEARATIREAGPEAVHIFGGLGAYRGVQEALVECIRDGGHRVGVMAECPARAGLAGAARFLLGALRRLRFGSHIDFLLGLGEHSGIRFRQLGYDAKRVFDFAYYPPLPPANETPSGAWPEGKVRLLHVGELSLRKGIDRVIESLAMIGGDGWCYGLVGLGKDERRFRTLAAEAGIGGKVLFFGAMPNPEAMRVLAGADVLILASRMDGYGAVVNEALMRGVPVICSSDCGARQAVAANPVRGSVFSSPESLRAALERRIRQGTRDARRTAAVRAQSECITPECGAAYFLEVMEHVYGNGARPVAPWLRKP